MVQIDAAGVEQIRTSRVAMEVVGSGVDRSADAAFAAAQANGVYYGPVYYRRESQPYLSLGLRGNQTTSPVAIAEVNLLFIWNLIADIDVGTTGYAYVVDAGGNLIVHKDVSLPLRNLNYGGLPQVAAALAGEAVEDAAGTVAFQGEPVVVAAAPIERVGWTVFVEQPIGEALQPIYASILRTAGLLLVGLGIAAIAGWFLARRMVVPIAALSAGAAQIGGGDLARRIDIRTGDELEGLADRFNDMAGRLQESRAGLERRVAERTAELARSVEELRALGEVSQAVNSTLDLQAVLTTIVSRAVQLSGAEAGGIHEYDEPSDAFLAARLCARAESGQILVSGRVAQEVAAERIVRPLGDAELKGFARPVPVYDLTPA